ncbi:hypothetical protein D3C79_672250 [compost metagenome]
MRVGGLVQLPVDLAAHRHHRVHLAGLQRAEGLLHAGIVMGLGAEHAVEHRGQVERRHTVYLDPDGVLLEHRDTGHRSEAAAVIGYLPTLFLIGAEHHHLGVFQLAQFVASLRIGVVVGHAHHQVGQLLLAQRAAAPDVVAQVVVELLAGRGPDQLQAHAQGRGQGLRQVHVDTARLAVILEAVGREILVHRHLQFTGGDHRVKVAHLRLHRCAAQQQASQQHGERTHGHHSSTCTLSR